MNRSRRLFVWPTAATLLVAACGKPGSFENLLDISVCDPHTGTFTLNIDNPFPPAGRSP